MSWKESLTYLKNIASKHGVDSINKESRADDDLPMGAKIGSLLNIQLAPFLQASDAGSLITEPTDSDCIIKSIGHVKLDFPGNIYRYYLSTGDVGNEDEKFLQVIINDQNEVIETMYCSRIVRYIPETEDEQNAFTGEWGVGLGQLTYTLWNDQLSDCGIVESKITHALNGAEQLNFTREIGTGDFVRPFDGTEVRIDDAQGIHGVEEKIWFSPYARSLTNGSSEHLLITTSVVNSRDGDNSKRSIHVDFMVGIIIEKERISIQ